MLSFIRIRSVWRSFGRSCQSWEVMCDGQVAFPSIRCEFVAKKIKTIQNIVTVHVRSTNLVCQNVLCSIWKKCNTQLHAHQMYSAPCTAFTLLRKTPYCLRITISVPKQLAFSDWCYIKKLWEDQTYLVFIAIYRSAPSIQRWWVLL